MTSDQTAVQLRQGSRPILSIIGLGKLGSPMLAVFASRGFRVIGLDVNPELVELVRAGRAPVVEPQLEELLSAHRSNISTTEDYDDAVRGSDVTFVVVPTPSSPDGTFSLRHVQAACERIGDALRRKSGCHVVVITSTVLPQDTGTGIMPILEQRSGKVCGRDFGLCYSPEFIALGSVVRDMLNPDFILIGESDARAGRILEDVYRRTVGDRVPVAHMSFENAELAKIAVNTFVTTKISYANMLAEVCEKIPGCDVDVVTSAVGLDSRIGPKYLKGRMGYGGPCFPRDNVAFSAMARRRGATAGLAEATHAHNERQVTRLLDRVRPVLPPGGRVGVLGLAYKPNTTVVEESQGMKLAQALVREGVPVVVYDPLAMTNAKAVLGDAVEYAPSLAACVERSRVLAIATPCEEFRTLTAASLAHNPRRVVVDCWRVLDADTVRSVADYITVGKGTGAARPAGGAPSPTPTATPSFT
jgi:UDPglucose 6-dehydrogenase